MFNTFVQKSLKIKLSSFRISTRKRRIFHVKNFYLYTFFEGEGIKRFASKNENMALDLRLTELLKTVLL